MVSAMDTGSTNLARPCLAVDVNATEGIEDRLALAHDGRILDRRQLRAPDLEGRVNRPNGHNDAGCLDAGGRPCVP